MMVLKTMAEPPLDSFEMPNPVRTDLHTVDDSSFPYIFEQNATIELQSGKGLVRCNIYRPKGSGPDCKVPVIATYGPYGKDTFYGDFHAKSFEEVNPAQKSAHSAWETPDPAFWTRHGYAVVRADEIGIGQSPGRLDTMSRNTSEAFFDVIEWAAAQPWSNGKVGLLGVSYYAGSQWRVAAMKPKGLAAMVPWEGMSDYYRDRCRHGGILSNNFIDFWWNRQVVSNQYGRPCDEEIITNEKTNGVGPMRPKSAPESLEGTLSAEERAWNRQDQTVDNRRHRFRDEEYYASKEYDMGDIDVPLLSVANWGGITLHLRGNIEGFVHAGSEQKWLRTITGRHDLPFYYREEVEIQRSFLDAFLKNEDRAGWKKGHVPRVSLVLRQGDVSFNNAAVERPYPRRPEKEWPIARTIWKKYYLTPRKTLISDIDEAWISPQREKLTYEALGSLENPQLIQFSSVAFRDRTEITGNIVVHLCVSATPEPGGPTPSDIDLFVTLRHISPKGTEIFYTGTAGDPVPLTKGWLRVSLRKVDKEHPKHREYLPWRQYASTDVLPVIVGEIYEVDVEVWPTSVVVEPGGQLVLEVASGDTQGCGIFRHDDPVDRSPAKFQGRNHVCFGLSLVNYIMLPVIPLEQSTDTMRDFQSSHSRVERGLLRCPRNNTSPHSLSLQRR